jgi:hypothetical protein
VKSEVLKVIAPNPAASTSAFIRINVGPRQRIRINAIAFEMANNDGMGANSEPNLVIEEGDGQPLKWCLQGMADGSTATVAACIAGAPDRALLSNGSAGNAAMPGIWFNKNILVEFRESQILVAFQISNPRLWYELETD